MKIKFMPFYNVDGDIGTGESLSVESVETTDTETASVSDDTEAADVTKQQSFAHRLKEQTEKAIAEERVKWEQETSEKYKDYDTHKELSQFLQDQNGVDALTLKEQIEMQRLQERAAKENIPLEVQQRLEMLEAKATKADELEAQQQQEQQTRTYFDTLNKFMDGKEGVAEDLNKFMIENDLRYEVGNIEKSLNLAYKAMQYDVMQKKLESAEKDGMKKLIDAKGNISTIPSKAAQGQVVSAPPKTFAEARARAMQREF